MSAEIREIKPGVMRKPAPQPGLPMGRNGHEPFVLAMQTKMEELTKQATIGAFHRGYAAGIKDGFISWLLFGILTFAAGIVWGMVFAS